ncbi:hypothetical protein AYI68_g6335 [Smittium mucronatum]|uniref:Uncharacterized protein n=1 Tax=Smittium mucronatum TaxID=133383 RepID=A0A1R0GRR7_9FUNG|nr:hypothetical protein AYI68_g6335 [Smittium mucronatum]
MYGLFYCNRISTADIISKSYEKKRFLCRPTDRVSKGGRSNVCQLKEHPHQPPGILASNCMTEVISIQELSSFSAKTSSLKLLSSCLEPALRRLLDAEICMTIERWSGALDNFPTMLIFGSSCFEMVLLWNLCALSSLHPTKNSTTLREILV